MARLILDTGVLIATERARGSLQPVIEGADDLAIAAVSMAEFLLGVELADTSVRDQRVDFAEALLGTVQVVDYDRVVARSHARLMAQVRREGEPRGAHDLIVAATAVATGRRLVTTDRRARFDGLVGLDVVTVPRA